MKERIEHMLGNSEARNLFIGTFHSVFSRILRVEATRLGYPANFTIYDTDDAKSVIKTIVKEKNLDDKTYKASIIYNRISSAKNNLYTYREYQADAEFNKKMPEAIDRLIGQIF
jgi:DNA helicase-2/ATP-dependent DNA helicase PcrA